MNKAILISIKPKYVAKILNGKKTIEIRKTFPKCELPIDVYIYCTKGNGVKDFIIMYKHDLVTDEISGEYVNTRVIAKFTLNKVEEIKFDDKQVQEQACLTEEELFDYLFINNPYHEDMHKGYAWHIDNLEIFDRPRPLQPFFDLDRPPQSWCYIEV